EDGIRDRTVTGVQTCALPISLTELTPAPVRLQRYPRSVSASSRRTSIARGSGVELSGRARRRWTTFRDAPHERQRHGGQGEDDRSEERRVGKEGRTQGEAVH